MSSILLEFKQLHFVYEVRFAAMFTSRCALIISQIFQRMHKHSARVETSQTVANRCTLNTAHKLITHQHTFLFITLQHKKHTMNTPLDKSKTSVLDAESERIVKQALDSSGHTVMIVALQFSKMGPSQK